jgi:hypothetical protein
MYRHDVKYDAVFKELDGNGCSNLSLLLKKKQSCYVCDPSIFRSVEFSKKAALLGNFLDLAVFAVRSRRAVFFRQRRVLNKYFPKEINFAPRT